MNDRRVWAYSPFLVLALGAGLFLVAVVHHARELLALNGLLGPLIAFLLDGLPALGLAAGGYRLSRTGLPPEDRRTAVVWSLGGGVLFLAVMGATFLVRSFEGRTVAEPVFPLLIAVEAGAIAGLIAGYYHVRARADARRARSVSDALAFVNDLIRHDLRNDLNVIRGRAELLATQRDAADAESGGGDPEVIAEKTDEALTRIETTRAITDTLVGNPDLEPVDLVGVTAELAAHVEATFDVAVTADLPERARVTANAGLRSVVDNLLENAAEHNDADDPRIAVAVETDAGAVRLTVRDNGPGIPAEQKETLFDVHGRGADGAGSPWSGR